MEMNRYLIAALYVVAGCMATIPVGIRGSGIPVGTDSYRLLISSTEKVITICTDKKSMDDFDYGLISNQTYIASADFVQVRFSYCPVALPGWKVPEVTSNPIRAPGESKLILDL